MVEATSTALILKALAYGLPAAILIAAFLVFSVVAKNQKDKTDQDRLEHIKKWDSMVATQREATEKLISSHNESIMRLLKSHQDETDRNMRLYERLASSLEALAHNSTIVSQSIERKTICPIRGDK
jgi:uncharacterized membrane protein (DUF106 family)